MDYNAELYNCYLNYSYGILPCSSPQSVHIYHSLGYAIYIKQVYLISTLNKTWKITDISK